MTIMLVPNPPRAEEESPLPPPYTPPTTVSAENLHVYLEANLRGGDVRPSVLQDNHHLPSAAAYFEDRPCTIPYPSYILYYPVIFTPNATRDDFPFPQPEHQYRSRDLLEHDWNTFLNYLLPPDMEPGRSKERVRRLRSKDALRDQDRIEAVLAEWHQGFFAPRGIRLEARFPGSDPSSITPPPPFTSTANVAHYPEAGASSAEDIPFGLEVSQPSMPHGQSPLQWARNNIIGQRFGSGPFARLPLLPDNSNKNNEQCGNHGDCSSCRDRLPHEMHERRGRSSSFSCSSSSSRSSSDSGYGGRDPHHHHHEGNHHGDWHGHHGRHPHHGRHGPGHCHHRSSSPPSSSSSSTSTSSPSSTSLASLSISSSSLSATSPHLIHNAISTLRQYQHHPDRTTLVSTLRNFKAEIRAAKKHQHRESTTSTNNTTPTTHSTQPPPRTLKNDLKAQRKTLKNELKAFVKEAKAVRKAERKERKAERKGRRKQRRAEKKEWKRMGGRKGGVLLEKSEEKEARALTVERKVVLEKEVARIMAAEPGGGSGERERATSSDLANRIMEGKWGGGG